MFDRRGAGASDPVPLDALATWEEWTEDLRAVLDAVGSERAAIYAELDAGPVGMIFAATHPERTSALVLGNTVARYAKAEDYPDGAAPEAVEQIVEMFRTTWGTEQLIARVFPSMASDPAFLRWRAKFTRASATPRTAAAQYRYIFGMDVRSVLSTIAVPTLVLHRSNFSLVPIEHGRYIADHIPGARFVEVAGGDAWFFTEGAEEVLDEVAEFLTGVRPPVAPERMVATVLLSDIVGSTERASRLGDRSWRALLDSHYMILRAELDRFGGREIATAGDGFFATFAGPARAISCALAMRDAIHGLGIEIRIGLHTGEVEVVGEDLAGIAVDIGARVAGAAQPGEVLVSRTVADLVAGSGIPFRDRGVHQLKGVPGSWQLYAVDK
jgi:class 3 adenylate cyclase